MTNKEVINYLRRIAFFIDEIQEVVRTLEEREAKGKATDYEIMLKNHISKALKDLER